MRRVGPARLARLDRIEQAQDAPREGGGGRRRDSVQARERRRGLERREVALEAAAAAAAAAASESPLVAPLLLKGPARDVSDAINQEQHDVGARAREGRRG